MFDDLIINKAHLPVELKEYEKGWQTKSLDCYLNLIEIKDNGMLFETNFYDGIDSKVEAKRIYHTGEIRFYQQIKNEWYVFVGFFDDGIMFRLIQIEPNKK